MAALGIWIALLSQIPTCIILCATLMHMQVRSAGFERDPIVREYGLRVHDRMEEVEGRVLNPPAIQYKGNGTVRSQHHYLHNIVNLVCMHSEGYRSWVCLSV